MVARQRRPLPQRHPSKSFSSLAVSAVFLFSAFASRDFAVSRVAHSDYGVRVAFADAFASPSVLPARSGRRRPLCRTNAIASSPASKSTSVSAFSFSSMGSRSGAGGVLLRAPRASSLRASSDPANGDDGVSSDGSTVVPTAESGSDKSSTTRRANEEDEFLYRLSTVVGKTTSTFVSVSFFAVLAYQRDALTLSLFLGAISNGVLAKILKKVVNHERPKEMYEKDEVLIKPSDGGMPSSHAMSLGFIFTSVMLGMVPEPFRLVWGAFAIVYSTLALRYRIRTQLHTVAQIFVGSVLGVVNGWAWATMAIGAADFDGPVMVWVRRYLLDGDTGLFPYTALAAPALIGLMVVGSFERRIGRWMENKRKK